MNDYARLAKVIRYEAWRVCAMRINDAIEINGVTGEPKEADLAAIRAEIRGAVTERIDGAPPSYLEPMLETAFAFLSLDLGQFGRFDLRGGRVR